MPVLRKEGRGMTTTPAGESLLGYARRLLELNDEAAAVRGAELAGSVRLGIQQDFGEQTLTEVLGRYTRVHPQVRIEARVARNSELMELLEGGKLDLALAWDNGIAAPLAVDVGRLPMRWIAPADETRLALDGKARVEPLPLVMMDAPCIMRSAAIRALDQAGIAWRIASPVPACRACGRRGGGVWADGAHRAWPAAVAARAGRARRTVAAAAAGRRPAPASRRSGTESAGTAPARHRAASPATGLTASGDYWIDYQSLKSIKFHPWNFYLGK
jgi:DNA-binding transcriptional LysR family regulator